MKPIIALLLSIILCSGLVAAAPAHPFPISGRISVNGFLQEDGFGVKLENLNSGETIFTKVRNGAYFFQNINDDLWYGYNKQKTDFSGNVFPGDRLRITACSVHADCVYEFEIVEAQPMLLDFHIVDEGIPPPKYVCWDDSIVDNSNDCPAVPDPEPEEPEVVTKVTTIDDKTASIEANYGDKIEVKIANSKLSILKDSEVSFDGDDYDFREIVYLHAELQTSIDDSDFGTKPYLVIPEGGVEYRFLFDDKVKIEDIEDDETLIIELLGKEYEIIKASNDEVTLISGDEYSIDIGESVEIGGKTVTVKTINEDYIYIEYDGSSAKVMEGEVEQIGDLEFYAYEVMDSNDEGFPSFVTLMIAEDVLQSISDGDDYDEGDDWQWNINLPDYLGVSNQNDYKDIDDDYVPLTVGDSIRLPNDYAVILVDSVIEPELIDIEFRVKNGYLFADGSEDAFVSGTKEYDKVYIDANGIYDKDYELISDDKVRLGDSDIFLELGSVIIGKLKIELDMSDILHTGVSYITKDETFMDYLGIIFSDVEEAVDDKSGFKVKVPEERPEVKITISSEVVIKEPTPEPPVEPTEPDPEEEEEEDPVPPPRDKPLPDPEPTPDPIPVEPDTPDEEGISAFYKVIIGLAIAVLSAFSWGKGFTGLANYYFKKGKELEKQGKTAEAKKMYDRAAKMLKTAMNKAKDGKYKG